MSQLFLCASFSHVPSRNNFGLAQMQRSPVIQIGCYCTQMHFCRPLSPCICLNLTLRQQNCFNNISTNCLFIAQQNKRCRGQEIRELRVSTSSFFFSHQSSFIHPRNLKCKQSSVVGNADRMLMKKPLSGINLSKPHRHSFVALYLHRELRGRFLV